MSGELDRAFEQVVEVAREQARATASLVEIERQNTSKLDALMSVTLAQTTALAAIGTSLSHADKFRAAEVADLKAHTAAEVAVLKLQAAKSDRSWKVFLWLATAALSASQIIGALIARRP